MKLITAAFSLILVLLFSSCQKELDIDTGDTSQGQNGVNDSIYVSQYVELDTTEPSGFDTSFKYLFAYDGQKRITTIKEYNYFTGTTSLDEITTENYFYTGSDTLPYKLIILYADGSNILQGSDTVFLEYDNAGLVKTDSLRTTDFSGTHVMSVHYTPLSGGKYKLSGLGLTYDSIIINQTTINGNITGETINYYNGGTMSSSLGLARAYDNKPNPFYRIAIHYPTAFNFSHTYFANEQKNNYAELTDNDPSFPEHYLINYEYRSDGYPLVSRLFDPGNPADAFKGIFTYIHL